MDLKELKNMENNVKRILIITYDFYPDNSPNTYRWFNILKLWEKDKIEIFVVTAQKENFLPYEELGLIKIFRVGENFLDKLKKNINRSKTSQSNISNKNVIYSNEKLSLLKKIYNLTWKKIYFPDFAFLWEKPAHKKAEELILNYNIHNVITISWPFTDHLVGNRLKKKHNINWIADTIDPFYLSKAVNNYFFYKRFNKNLESRVLNKADKITVLTPKLKSAYLKLYPHLNNKIEVNHNVFVPVKYKNNFDFPKDNSIFLLTFVGTLAKKTREPHQLLKFFTYLVENNKDSKIIYQLHFYGNHNQFTKDFNNLEHLMNKNIFLHGFIDRDKVTDVINKSNIVVNIGNNNKYQEPSKVLEYVYLQKPILNICSIKDDTAEELLKFYPHVFNLKYDIENNLNLLSDFQRFCNENKIIEIDYTNYIENYLIDKVEKRYFNLLKF